MKGVKVEDQKKVLTIPNRPLRRTKQVRVSVDWWRTLKRESVSRGLTISKFLDKICQRFFENEEQTRDTN